MQFARAKIIRPPMAMVMLEGSRFEKGDMLRTVYTVHYIQIKQKRNLAAGICGFGIGGEPGWTTALCCVVTSDVGIYCVPRDRLTLLPSPRPRTHHRCTFLRVGALDPTMPSSKRDMAMEMVPATPASLDRSGAMSLGNQLATAARI